MNDTAANTPKTANSKVLGNVWADRGLNPNLIAKIRPVIEGSLDAGQGNQTYTPDTNEPIVAALLEDAELSIESQYSTPFENSNPEGRMPNLMGMIQSGNASIAMYDFLAAGKNVNGFVGGVLDATGAKDALQAGAEQLEGLKGRSNFTKINSRQIFTSSNSIRITGTLVFQAWADAKNEVDAAIAKLEEWTVAKELSGKSLLVGAVTEGITEGLFPSIIPPFVQFQYGGKVYLPLVIENISTPIVAPMNPDGSRIAVKAQITLLSLTAWDRNDIIKLNA